MLYEAVAGDKPFGGETPVAIAHAVLAHEPDGLLERRPDVDVVLADTIARAMAKDPADRYASAAEMAAALVPATPATPTTPTSSANDPMAPPEPIFGDDDVTHVMETGTATAPVGELTRRLPAVTGRGRSGSRSSSGSGRSTAFRRNARARAVALAAVVVGITLVAVLALHWPSNGVGQTATPTTKAPATPAGTGRPSAQHPLPRALDDALKTLDQAVRP